LLVLFFEDEKEKDADSFLVFLIMSAIAILTADIPVLNGNDPPAWSVIGVSIHKMNEYGGVLQMPVLKAIYRITHIVQTYFLQAFLFLLCYPRRT
jgi:hypothetical protein